jgi:hypothetical protein
LVQIKRETTLTDAWETVRMLVEQLQKSRLSAGEREVGGNDLVDLEIEINSTAEEFELEFEIKWRARADGQQEAPARKGAASR